MKVEMAMCQGEEVCEVKVEMSMSISKILVFLMVNLKLVVSLIAMRLILVEDIQLNCDVCKFLSLFQVKFFVIFYFSYVDIAIYHLPS